MAQARPEVGEGGRPEGPSQRGWEEAGRPGDKGAPGTAEVQLEVPGLWGPGVLPGHRRGLSWWLGGVQGPLEPSPGACSPGLLQGGLPPPTPQAGPGWGRQQAPTRRRPGKCARDVHRGRAGLAGCGPRGGARPPLPRPRRLGPRGAGSREPGAGALRPGSPSPRVPGGASVYTCRALPSEWGSCSLTDGNEGRRLFH